MDKMNQYELGYKLIYEINIHDPGVFILVSVYSNNWNKGAHLQTSEKTVFKSIVIVQTRNEYTIKHEWEYLGSQSLFGTSFYDI